jgi:hypothetical protein
MMKNKLIGICAILTLFSLAGGATAATYKYTYTDTYNAGHLYMKSNFFSPDDSVSWQFNINSKGYDSSNQEVKKAFIKFQFQDDSRDFFEYAALQIGTFEKTWEVDTGRKKIRVNALTTLRDTGLLDVTLIAAFGDFYFNSAKLIARADDRTTTGGPPLTQNPIPSALLLMGSGLIAVAGAARRRKTKKLSSETTI